VPEHVYGRVRAVSLSRGFGGADAGGVEAVVGRFSGVGAEALRLKSFQVGGGRHFQHTAQAHNQMCVRQGGTASGVLVKDPRVFQGRPLRVFDVAHGLGLYVTQGKQLARTEHDQP